MSCHAAVPDFTTNGLVATDCNGSAPLQITQTPAAGTLVGLGVTTVTLHVIDAANNESTCTATFTVTDNIPPVITTCASNQSAFADGVCHAAVPDFTSNGLVATDCNGSAPLQITQSPAAGTLVGLGVTTVTLHVIDAANNESTCTATFSVVNTPPTLDGPSDLIQSVGQSATLSGTVSGTGPFSYQWTKDGVNIAGATDPIYTIASVSVVNAGSYCLVARDGCMSVTNCATLTVNEPTSGNDAPVAVNDSYTTPEDTQLTVIAPGVLANDSDVDADTLSAVLVSNPSHGTLTLRVRSKINSDFAGGYLACWRGASDEHTRSGL